MTEPQSCSCCGQRVAAERKPPFPEGMAENSPGMSILSIPSERASKSCKAKMPFLRFSPSCKAFFGKKVLMRQVARSSGEGACKSKKQEGACFGHLSWQGKMLRYHRELSSKSLSWEEASKKLQRPPAVCLCALKETLGPPPPVPTVTNAEGLC